MTEEDDVRIYHSLDNARVYHGSEPQFIDISAEVCYSFWCTNLISSSFIISLKKKNNVFCIM